MNHAKKTIRYMPSCVDKVNRVTRHFTLALAASFVLASCGGGGGGNASTGNINAVTIQGSLAVAAGDSAAKYTVFNSNQTSTATTAGSFSTAIAKDTPTYTFAVSDTGNKVYAAVNTSTDASVAINAQTTAEALVLLNPLLIPRTSIERANVTVIVKADPAVRALATVIESVYGSVATPMADSRISDALTSAVISVLTSWKASKVAVAKALQQSAPKSLALAQVTAGSTSLQIIGSDMGALTLANSTGSNLKLELAITGPLGSTTNVDWVVRVVELDPAKVQALGAALQMPASINDVDSLIKPGGYDQPMVIEGAAAQGWLKYVVDPVGSTLSSRGATLFTDKGLDLPRDGTYAVIALSGSPFGGLPGTSDFSSVRSSSWQQLQWAEAAGLNVGAIALDVVGTGAIFFEAYTGIEMPFAKRFDIVLATEIAALKVILTTNPGQISFNYFVDMTMKMVDELLESLRPQRYASVNDITWSGVKYFVVNVAVKNAQSVFGVLQGSFDGTSRLYEFLFGVKPRESAYVVVRTPSAQADTTPPSIPTGLAATAVASSQINLSWNAATDNVGVAGYKIFKNGSVLPSQATLSYSDTALSPSTQYCYTVAAFDAAGNVSTQSSTQCATTQAGSTVPTAPAAPTGISATAGNGQATISWNAVAGATSYNLYMASVTGVTKSNYSSLAGGVKIAGVTSPKIQTSLTNGTPYYFVVTAVNASGESIESSQVSAIPQASSVAPYTVTEFGAGITAGAGLTFITSGPDGSVWFTEANLNRIGRITPAGVVTEFNAFSVAGGGFGGITSGPDGNLWFTSLARIGRITPAGVVTEFRAGLSSGANLSSITTGPDGNLWFTDVSKGIGRITPAGVITEFSVGTSGSSGYPTAITAGPDGNLWFTEYFGNRIGRITPSGVVTEFSAGISFGALPLEITAGPDGNLWFSERFGNRIGRITPVGVVTEFNVGGTPNTLRAGITAGPDGNLWFANYDDNRIGRITPAGVVTEFSAGISANAAPGYITAGADGNLWFTESFHAYDNRVGRMTLK